MACSGTPFHHRRASSQNQNNSTFLSPENVVHANSAIFARISPAPSRNTQRSIAMPQRYNQGTLSREDLEICLNWTLEEQYLLEDSVARYASESPILRFSKIAFMLSEKTVRDVAVRSLWMSRRENGKRPREEPSPERRSKGRKVNDLGPSTMPPSHPTPSSGLHSSAPVIAADIDGGISYKDIGGVSGKLLEANELMFSQISANLAALQLHDNINLLARARENIFTILNDIDVVPEEMNRMPPLPVKLNEELASCILPGSSH